MDASGPKVDIVHRYYKTTERVYQSSEAHNMLTGQMLLFSVSFVTRLNHIMTVYIIAKQVFRVGRLNRVHNSVFFFIFF